MQKEAIIKQQGKRVRLIFGDDDKRIIITGVIDNVDDDSIVFTSSSKTSILHFDQIKAIEPLEEVQGKKGAE